MSNPNIPRDPRQLARDILAGKVSIEELAREQARRRSQTVGGPTALPPQRQAESGPVPQATRVPAPVNLGAKPQPMNIPQSRDVGNSQSGVPMPLPQSAPSRQLPSQRMPSKVAKAPQPLRPRVQTAPKPAMTYQSTKLPEEAQNTAYDLPTAKGSPTTSSGVGNQSRGQAGGGGKTANQGSTASKIALALRNKNVARRAMILSEILQPPVSLR